MLVSLLVRLVTVCFSDRIRSITGDDFSEDRNEVKVSLDSLEIDNSEMIKIIISTKQRKAADADDTHVGSLRRRIGQLMPEALYLVCYLKTFQKP